MNYGFTGKILKIDLSTNKIEVEKKDEIFYRKYYGGGCLASYYLLTGLAPGIDPLSADNIIIFATSPIVGAPCSGLAMHSVISKSPLTNLVGESVTPGFIGPEIKKAGYDAIIIKGKAKNPSYIYVNNGKIYIKDASKIWGKVTSKSFEILKKELKEDNVHIALIGPAGENLVRFASIVNDSCYISSRCGLGAVMGSKNLKALCIRGTKNIDFYDSAKLKELGGYFRNNFLSNPLNKIQFQKSSYWSVLEELAESGLIATKNFKEGFFEKDKSIKSADFLSEYDSGNVNCYFCEGGCKKALSSKKDLDIKLQFGLIEFETLLALVYNLQITGIENIMQLWNLICDYGIDGTSLGVTIAFAMECYENNLLSKADNDNSTLMWGDTESIIGLIDKITFKKGIGQVLSEGTRKAASLIKGSKKYAMHVKGLEIPMHEPRVKQMLGLGYAVSPIGAYFTVVEHDTDFDFDAPQLFMDKAAPLTIYDREAAASLSDKKVRMFYLLQPAFSMYDALCSCIFAFSPVRFFNYEDLVRIVNNATGWESSLFELWKLGEKRINMFRLFAIREGLDVRDDILPERFFEPIKSGTKKGVYIKKDDFIKARSLYYEMAGWDKKGVPGYPKLLELDIEEFLI